MPAQLEVRINGNVVTGSEQEGEHVSGALALKLKKNDIVTLHARTFDGREYKINPFAHLTVAQLRIN